MPRTPTHPKVASDKVKPSPGRNRSPVCWAIQGVMASTNSRYRNITSKVITNTSMTIICTRNLYSRSRMASDKVWRQAKLPMMSRNRKMNRTVPVYGGVAAPTRPASTSATVGRSV